MNIRTSRYEEWQNRLEKHVDFNICESMVAAFTTDELLALNPDAAERLRARMGEDLLNYGWIEGSAEFKRAVASLYRTEVDPDRILQTNGGTGANLNALMCLVEPGDHVVIESPAYEPLEILAHELGAKVDLWHLREECDWQPDIAELERLVRPDTKAVILVNASNPLGVVLERPVLEQVVEIARGVGAYVMCDEAFRPFDDTLDYASVVDLYERSVVTCTMSKAFSLPGIRVGWVVGDAEMSRRVRTLRDYTCVSCGVHNDLLATFALENRDAVLGRNREIVFRNLRIADEWVAAQPRASWLRPRGVTTGYLRLDIPQDDVDFCRRLATERKTLLIPGGCFDLPRGARLGYCAHEPVLREGLRRLAAALAEFD
ncbi:MAG: aminotransferase class I/II-fold pyridoxal phosphate-dependent enzyme [Atopobiaceae bacterium]|nr:aminotransferase class I/II-fold pyridoxal phosphate-dependent enzyme [Atopobiaceae bacterium]